MLSDAPFNRGRWPLALSHFQVILNIMSFEKWHWDGFASHRKSLNVTSVGRITYSIENIFIRFYGSKDEMTFLKDRRFTTIFSLCTSWNLRIYYWYIIRIMIVLLSSWLKQLMVRLVKATYRSNIQLVETTHHSVIQLLKASHVFVIQLVIANYFLLIKAVYCSLIPVVKATHHSVIHLFKASHLFVIYLKQTTSSYSVN